MASTRSCCLVAVLAVGAAVLGVLLPVLGPVRSPCEFAASDVPSQARALAPGSRYANASALQRHIAFFDLDLDQSLTVSEIFHAAQMVNCFSLSAARCRVASFAIAALLGSISQGTPSLVVDVSSAGLARLVHAPAHSDVYDASGGADLRKVEALFLAADADRDGALSEGEVKAWIGRTARGVLQRLLMGGEFPILVRMSADIQQPLTREVARSLFDGSFVYNFAHTWRSLNCRDGQLESSSWFNSALQRALASQLPKAVIEERAEVLFGLVHTTDLHAAEQVELRAVVTRLLAGGGPDLAAPHLLYVVGAIRMLRTVFSKLPAVKPGLVGVPRAMAPVPRLDALGERLGLGRSQAISGLPFEFSSDDEDFPEGGVKDEVLWKVAELYGYQALDDTDEAFSSTMEGEVCLHMVFGLFFPRRKYQYGHHAGYGGSDEALTQLFFYGSGASLVERAPADGWPSCASRLMNVAPLRADEPGVAGRALERCRGASSAGVPRAAFLVDLAAMTRYATREQHGIVRYGAVATFDAAHNVQAIFVGHLARWVLPGDAEWAHAKHALRASTVTFLTAVEHLLQTHLLYSNPVQLALREEVPATHPLRRLLKPFVFRSGMINAAAAKLLLPPLSLVHRAFGLQYESLVQLIADARAGFRFRPVRQSVLERNLDGRAPTADEPELPYVNDGFAVYDVLHRYVTAYAKAHMPGVCGDAGAQPGVADDYYLARFWARMRAATPGLPEYEAGKHLCDFIATFMFAVTAGHELVGDLSSELANPYFHGKLRPGSTMADVKTFLQLALVMALTSTPMPRLVEYYPHLHLTPQAKDLHEQMTREMLTLSGEIRRRNTKRRFPFLEFDPVELESSVSV